MFTSSLSLKEKNKLEDLWSQTSNILCESVLKLFPDAEPVSGECTESGFFYDFANLNINSDDFRKLENLIKEISKEDFIQYDKLNNIDLSKIKTNKYRKHIIESKDNISVYVRNQFNDLSFKIPGAIEAVKAVKIIGASSTYWMGDSKNESLIRIHGVSFGSEKEMKKYNEFMEEVKKRDHRELGKKLGIFMFSELAPGFPFILPNGSKIMNELDNFWRNINKKREYQEIKTPAICSIDLWKTSGHADHYIDNMFQIKDSKQESPMALKAMNCPATMLYFNSLQVSYKDLPLRISEKGSVFRNELSGSLSGLCRVRNFHQDDAHIFVDRDTIKAEMHSVIDIIDEVYTSLSLDYSIDLATRPEKSCGTDEEWELATNTLKEVLEERKVKFNIQEGDGAFYGPKIDIYIKDAINRTWQCGTVQLDFGIAERFNLTFNNKNNDKERPIIIHRAIFGSFERFLAILIEHFAGKLPLWLSPSKVAIISLAKDMSYPNKIKESLGNVNCPAELILDEESLSKKVRDCIAKNYNYIVVVGEKEMAENCVSVRIRGESKSKKIDYKKFIDSLAREIDNKEISSYIS